MTWGSPLAVLEQISELNGPRGPQGMVCALGGLALCLGALTGVFLMGEHASFPGLRASWLGQHKLQKPACL